MYTITLNCTLRGVFMDKKQNDISKFLKQKRKEYGINQVEFAEKSGLGLRFVRELEQGKTTVRLDKVNRALSMFGHTVTIRPMEEEENE